MTDVLIKWGNRDTDTHANRCHVKTWVMLPHAKNYQKRGKRPRTDLSLALTEGAWPSSHPTP